MRGNKRSYFIDSKRIINEIVGDPKSPLGFKIYKGDKKLVEQAKLAHQELYTNLMQLVNDIGIVTNYSLKGTWKLRGLQRHLHFSMGIPGYKEGISANPYNIIAANKKFKRMLENMKRSKFDQIEKAFMPAAVFAANSDRLGILDNIVNQVNTYTPRSRQAYAGHQRDFSDLTYKVGNHVDKVIKQYGITNNMLFEGIPMDWNSEEVIVGKYYEEDGKIRPGIQYNKGGARFYTAFNSNGTRLENISANEIDATLKDEIIKYHQNEVTKDLAAGQMRNVVFKAKATGRDEAAVIREIRRANSRKKARKDSGYYRAYNAKKGLIFHYVMIKTSERGTEDEHYNAYPVEIFQKIDGGKGIKPVAFLYDAAPDAFRKGYDPRVFLKNGKRARMPDLDLTHPDFSVLRNGYYNSKHITDLGESINKWMHFIEGSSDRQYSHFEYMKNQPNAQIMSDMPTEDSVSIMTGLRGYRAIMRRVADDMASISGKTSFRMDQAFKKTYRLMSKRIKTDSPDAAAIMISLSETIGINSKLFIDEDSGDIHTPDSYFRRKGQNASPMVFSKGAFLEMLTTALADIRLRQRTKAGMSQEAKELLEDQEKFLSSKLSLIKDDKLSSKELYDLSIQFRTGAIKHRGSLTDPTLRRKDAMVDHEYLDSTYRSLYANELLADMLESVNAWMEHQAPGEYAGDEGIEYIVSRVKIALGDPSASGGIGPIDLSFERTAQRLNKLRIFGTNHTARSIKKLTTHIRSITSGMALSIMTALGNRTQSLNPWIHSSTHYYKQTQALLHSTGLQKLRIDAIMDNTGVGEMIQAISDLVSTEKGLTFKDDVMFYSVGSQPIFPLTTLLSAKLTGYPRNAGNMLALNKISRKGLAKAIMQGIPEVDAALDAMENVGAGDIKKKLKILLPMMGMRQRHEFKNIDNILKNELSKTKDDKTKRELKTLRSLLAKFMVMPYHNTPGSAKEKEENKNFKEQAEILQELLGDVGENRKKKSLAWKLGISPVDGAEAFLTMSEGEKYMHIEAALMAMLQAADMGSIGEPGKSKQVSYDLKKVDGTTVTVNGIKEVFMSKEAVNVAQTASLMSIFGMTPMYLGTAFSGIGRGWFQYHEFTIQQLVFEYNIARTFLDGSDKRGIGDVISRLKQAHDAIEKRNLNQHNESSAPSNQQIDKGAESAYRFLISRGAISMAAATLEAFPTMRALLRVTPLTNLVASRGMHAADSVMLGFPLRMGMQMFVWLMMGIFSDGPDEEDIELLAVDTGINLLRFFVPTPLSIFASAIYKGYYSYRTWGNMGKISTWIKGL